MRADLKNHIRGALKTHGFVVLHSVEKGFKVKIGGIIKESLMLQKMITPLLRVLETVEPEIPVKFTTSPKGLKQSLG
jgi:hypothetical protein